MGRLKFCLVGSWKNPPDHLPDGFGVGSLAHTTWRLKGSLLVAL